MSIRRRLNKLEAKSPSIPDHPIVFYEISGIKKGTEESSRVVERAPGPARVCGLGLGHIYPKDGETRTEFRRRVYAVRAGGKLIEYMTDEERLKAFAAAELEFDSGSREHK